MTKKNGNARMAIGIGDEQTRTARVSENWGSAYTLSGRGLNELENNLSIFTEFPQQKHWAAEFSLLSLICDEWNTAGAAAIHELLVAPDLTQTELGKRLKVSQANISIALQRSNWNAVKNYLDFFEANFKAE